MDLGERLERIGAEGNNGSACEHGYRSWKGQEFSSQHPSQGAYN